MNKRQAIPWTNDVPVYRRVYTYMSPVAYITEEVNPS